MGLSEHIDAGVKRAAARAEALGLAFSWVQHAAADALAIRHCEEKVGELPSDFKGFLAHSDGATISIEHEYSAGRYAKFVLNVLSAESVTEQTLENRHSWDIRGSTSITRRDGSLSWGPLIVFADWGDGNLCVFDPDQREGSAVPVIEVSPDIHFEEWRDIHAASSFEEWITRILDAIANGQHPLYWFPAKPLILAAKVDRPGQDDR